jgi:molecular chaperone DnaK (HSP70)
VSKTEVFCTVFDYQDAVDVMVYQGEHADALKNIQIGNFMFRGLSEVPAGNEIVITFELDLDGILQVRAVERSSGKEIRGVIESVVSRSSEGQISASRDKVSAMWGQEDGGDVVEDAVTSTERGQTPPLSAEIIVVINRAEEKLDTASPEDREEMINLIEDIRETLKRGDLKQAAELKEDLDDILFYLE